ncbi:ABC transporter ATP-binding protein [Kaistia algarum]|uniref:branched-chain amino acid ABC transporter ATP-binding protein n=1 Tax=Kaistia algarum TaxID=2083279 RepID=UPI000CE7BD14|nr:ABC transporter ATP-binding protein [Kaistia algarum]MCX5515811.1 ABC transporter ATP-binding protein [Kaistia algarum]PPE80816.1 ABC transporter ATP-binding protein [Kaistia algarum]
MEILSLRNVTAGYGTITVLNDLSLTLRAGEILTILGANGCGKSTVLKTAMGLTRVTSGALALGDKPITAAPPHLRAAAGLGYVPQTRNVFQDMSVTDNLRMGGYLRPKQFAHDVEEVFALFPRIKERRRERAGNLSGGERRMLSIGLTLLLKPKVLLLDEPSSDLAPATVDIVFRAIQDIHKTLSIPVLLVEQNVNKALEIADRVCVLVRGREALDVPAGEIDTRHLHDLFMDGGVRTS